MSIIYNKDQRDVINKGVAFLKNSSDQVFQFSGGPGTGKSVVLNAIYQEANIKRHTIAPMTYVGAAALVMRMKGFTNAKTIHSWLYTPVQGYMYDQNNNLINNDYFNRPKMELQFEPKILEGIDHMAMDEGGSTPLSLKADIESRDKKIIVCGDLDQLPPVEDEPAYLKYGEVHRLNEIMRQKQNSAIVYLADRAIKGLPIHKGLYGDCLVIDEDELTDRMVLASDIILCGKNKTREMFNKKIRYDLLKYRTEMPCYGERLICRKNNFKMEIDGISLTNGLIGTVVNSPGVHSFDGKSFKIDFKPNFIDSYFPNITCDYNYFIAPHEQRQYLKNNKYNVGEKFEFAYAITTHISQGSQFNNGIYFEEYLHPDIQRNLNYTAITRFSNSMIYVKRKRKFY